ncbi:cytochrome P450 [Actinokineospora auranticolor]|uniref:Cytochrome P450 n=1 Tax=Actinokineospora auranticolor TaxID=155976 RepID=A0A2S6H1U5_9PSEU|nr:cytochrome P450 [Actinokineospora auranticolor]PPK71455.1 cytochrome P450 [Actinokineospora auranticolor]
MDWLVERMSERVAELAPAPAGLRPVLGDPGPPVLGLAVQTVRDGPACQLALYRRFGPVSWWRAFGRRIVAVTGPEACRVVLTNQDKAFRTGWPDTIGPWFDGGLLALDAPEHLRARRLLSAAYSAESMAGYLAAMSSDIDAELSRWPVARTFAAVPALRALSSRVTTRAFLGLPSDRAEHIMRAVETCVRAETALLRVRVPGTAWQRAHRARDRLLTYLTAALRHPREGTDFLSTLSRVDGLTPRQAAEHLLFTLIASHDTTTAATIAAVYFLGKHPVWQDEARADGVTLDHAIRESIRLVSPSPIAMRVTTRDTSVLGHHIPAGQLVSVCTGATQLLPDLWPDPHDFDPTRMATPLPHRLAWLPFGFGHHKCVGEHLGMRKVALVVAALLERFKWSYPSTYDAPWRFTSLPAPADGLPLLLHPLD